MNGGLLSQRGELIAIRWLLINVISGWACGCSEQGWPLATSARLPRLWEPHCVRIFVQKIYHVLLFAFVSYSFIKNNTDKNAIIKVHQILILVKLNKWVVYLLSLVPVVVSNIRCCYLQAKVPDKMIKEFLWKRRFCLQQTQLLSKPNREKNVRKTSCI